MPRSNNPILSAFFKMSAHDNDPTIRAIAFLASLRDMSIAMGVSQVQTDNARNVLEQISGRTA